VADVAGTFTLGPDSGRLLLRTGRTGLAAWAGHDLTIEVTRWSARVTVPAEDGGSITAATVTAEIDLGSLAVREGTGGAKPLTDKDRGDIAATAKKILGSGNQAVARFTSSRIIPSADGAESAWASGRGGTIEGALAFRARSEPVRLQLTNPAPGRYRGTTTIRQSDFDITPYTGFFGALKLRDEVNIEFEVNLPPAPQE